MKTLLQVLEDARLGQYAVGHFNISDFAALKAIFEGAHELNLPIMIGVSEGEREFVGVREVAALVRTLREEYDYPIFLNADHTHSLEAAKIAAEAGYDEIIFDMSKLPFEDNLKQTREAVKMIKAINPKILVEGEIGYIGSSSEILSEVPNESLTLTTPEEAMRFVKETGVDVLAPAVGNMHGLLASMVSGETHKHLDIERVKALQKACGVFMTLHGGSGTEDKDFVSAAHAGMTIIHVNTEIRIAWRRGLEQALKDHPQEVAPYKLLPGAVSEIKKIVQQRLKLFSSQ